MVLYTRCRISLCELVAFVKASWLRPCRVVRPLLRGGQGPEIGHIDQREKTAARFGRRLDAEEVCALDIVNDERASFGNLLRI